MKRTYHQPDYVLAATVLVLIMLGLVMLSSAGSVLGFQRFGDSNYFLKKQLLGLAVGIVALAITFRIDYEYWRKWSVPLLIGTIAALILVFMPGLGTALLGARRWIHIGPVLFQPSELAKLTFIFYLAAWFERREHIVGRWQEGVVPYLLILGLMAGLLLLEPDLGTTIVLILMSVTMFYVAGGSPRHLVGLGAIGVALLAVFIKIAPYRAQRLTVFLNPALDPQGIGYHINQALLAIGSGGWFGLGLGHSRQKFNYLPEPAGDSIFAVTAEELGFLFVTIFILAWILFIVRGLNIARRAPDQFGRLVATGITVWLGFQAFLNIGALSGVLPLTGVPLPFMSYGGSALIMSLAALGVLLNISRQTTHQLRRT